LPIRAGSTADPEPKAIDALRSDERVMVTGRDGWTFEPTDDVDVGFVLYPGGRVDPAAYAVVARGIAGAGYLVVVPDMPLNLAVLDADVADDVIAAHPKIETWAIGGHSLGGTMAADHAGDRSGAISGLALWAAYPADGTDLSGANLPAVSIFGTNDGLTTLDDIERSRSRLPPDTRFVAIDGGNHAQFGSYGPQDGDHPATITPTDQQAQVVDATVDLLRRLD
jgi:pimeloyl-ACP methyl ester carboxylesterase